jgi:hypothetical protein
METIINQLNIVNGHLKGGKKRTLTVGQTEQGQWLVADDDIEIATLVVVRFMLKMNYTFIGQVNLTSQNRTYTLYNKEAY